MSGRVREHTVHRGGELFARLVVLDERDVWLWPGRATEPARMSVEDLRDLSRMIRLALTTGGDDE